MVAAMDPLPRAVTTPWVCVCGYTAPDEEALFGHQLAATCPPMWERRAAAISTRSQADGHHEPLPLDESR